MHPYTTIGVRWTAKNGVPGEQERDGVDPEARNPELEPEAEHAGNLLLDYRIRDVEVGLVLVEVVQVPLVGLGVQLPDTVLLIGKDDVLRAGLGLDCAPYVIVAVRVVRTAAGRLEPRVSVRRVIHNEVDDDPKATRRTVRTSSTKSPCVPRRGSTPKKSVMS